MEKRATFATFARGHEPYAVRGGNPRTVFPLSIFGAAREGSGSPSRVASARRSLPIARPQLADSPELCLGTRSERAVAPRSYGMDGWMALVDESIALYLHAKQRNTILQAILSYMKYLYENMVRANK